MMTKTRVKPAGVSKAQHVVFTVLSALIIVLMLGLVSAIAVTVGVAKGVAGIIFTMREPQRTPAIIRQQA